MDENKIIKLFNSVSKEEKPQKKQASSFALSTNPIIQRMLLTNLQNKKDKFKLKDLFR